MIDFLTFIDPVGKELHVARHRLVSFQPDDENPLLDMGFAIGFLFGMKVFKEYPTVGYLAERACFSQDMFGANIAADEVASAIREAHFPAKRLEETALFNKLLKLKEEKETEEITTVRPEDLWPLPIVRGGEYGKFTQ